MYEPSSGGVRPTATSFREWVRGLLGKSIFYGALIVIALTAVPYGTVDAGWESIFESAIFVLAILWLADGALANTGWIKEHRLLLPLFALVVFALIQSLPLDKNAGGLALGGGLVNRSVSDDPFETLRFALKLLAITLSFGLLLRYVSDAARLRILVYVVIGIALASALFGLLKMQIPQDVLGVALSRLPTERSYGQFENRNHFAFLMEMAIGLVLGLAVGNRTTRKQKIFLALSGLTLWAALLLTHSRGGVLSLAAEIIFFFLLYSRLRVVPNDRNSRVGNGRKRSLTLVTSKIVVAGFLLAAVAASAVLIGGDETIDRLESTPSEFSSSAGPPRTLRPEIWQATFNLIKDNPLVGVGFAGYAVAIPRYLHSHTEWTPQQAHNDYLEVLASGGVVAAVLCVWFLLAVMQAVGEPARYDSRAARAMKCGALAGLFAVAVHSLFDYGLHITVNALVFIALLVVVLKSGTYASLPASERVGTHRS